MWARVRPVGADGAEAALRQSQARLGHGPGHPATEPLFGAVRAADDDPALGASVRAAGRAVDALEPAPAVVDAALLAANQAFAVAPDETRARVRPLLLQVAEHLRHRRARAALDALHDAQALMPRQGS